MSIDWDKRIKSKQHCLVPGCDGEVTARYGRLYFCDDHGRQDTKDWCLPAGDSNPTLELLREHLKNYTDTSMPGIDAFLRAAADDIEAAHKDLLGTIERQTLTTTKERTLADAYGAGGPYYPGRTDLVVSTESKEAVRWDMRTCIGLGCKEDSTHQAVDKDAISFFCEDHYNAHIKFGKA